MTSNKSKEPAPMPEAAVALSIAALKAPLEDLYNTATGSIKRRIRNAQSTARIKEIYKSISAVQKVKTMWRFDREVKLLTFFYPSRVIVGKAPRQISSLSELSPSERIVLQGTVGQGKSIFLRFLCIKELSEAKRIPIFLELRRYSTKSSFKDFLIDGVALYGIPCDAATFDFLATSGKVVLMLDAFDEIETESVTHVLSEIENLVQKYPLLQVVITSRPDSGIEKSAHFRVYNLAPLTPHDHKPFIEKITDDKKKTAEILSAIQKSGSDVRSLLQTPLLLTLLVLIYNSTQEIPSSLSEFYEALFQTLVTRHDRTKPGYKRRRESKLSDPDLKKLFEAFCYAARQSDSLVLSEKALGNLVELACRATNVQCPSDAFISDITKVACLMQQEGFEYHFIHKSVVEFHAASFISTTSEENSQRFYNAMRESDKSFKWRQELVFLSQIDRQRYLRFFYIPSATELFQVLGLNPLGSEVLSTNGAKTFLNTIHVAWSSPNKHPADLRYIAPNIDNIVKEDLLMKCFDITSRAVKDSLATFAKEPGEQKKYGDCLERLGKLPEVTRNLGPVVHQLRRSFQAANTELALESRVAEFVAP